MPEIQAGSQRFSVSPGVNLLDALRGAGVAVPYSCRAGSCHACLVRCIRGEVLDALPEALDSARREEGWRLSCQCRVIEDLSVEAFDPQRDGLPATVTELDWLAPDVLRLRLTPQRPLRYSAGQHLILWSAEGVARPYSLGSVPGLDPWLEFHIDCRERGAFADFARGLKVGDGLRLGELRGGALHYDPEWHERPLLLMASGTGLAPLWGVLREALRQHHSGPIRVIHQAHDHAGHYLAEPLQSLAASHPELQVTLMTTAESAEVLAQLRLVSRRTLALLCGHPASVDAFARRLYLCGVPRGQTLADLFLPHA
ncbi:iron-sulfur-binding ferredoxin reductase [Pseudomonas nitroreducens]|uniref:Iron-sulfur-binding ferredoxin reductase n=1 Tax=Pseudomonas nitroreducens TaxID=46680 RepID=A0A5R8ZY50_PSENT|nr:iron-sulfur-binding ferredoxin reductase [Pseudomonas nitroreducens]TLP70854.1 iron-sulfur-binding ferredoxin reductase [Pseudomonas nitroreducens]